MSRDVKFFENEYPFAKEDNDTKDSPHVTIDPTIGDDEIIEISVSQENACTMRSGC